MTETLELLLSHSFVRAFTDDPVLQEDIVRAVTCGQRAATSSFI